MSPRLLNMFQVIQIVLGSSCLLRFVRDGGRVPYWFRFPCREQWGAGDKAFLLIRASLGLDQHPDAGLCH